MGCGATVRFSNGDPCTVSVARTSISVKKSRSGFLGAVLYREENTYKNAQTAMALAYLFQERRFPDGVHSPILRSFLNAILHCSSVADVSVSLNQAVLVAQKKLGQPLDAISPSELPGWATGHLANNTSPQGAEDAIRKLGALMETYPSAILDTTMLPLPKTEMKTALKQAWLQTKDAQWRNWLEVGYMTLASFQDGVGRTPCQTVHLPDIKPELLKNWFQSDAGKTTMAALDNFARWQVLAAKESDFLLAELNQWKAAQRQR
jgi:hypothetical protein